MLPTRCNGPVRVRVEIDALIFAAKPPLVSARCDDGVRRIVSVTKSRAIKDPTPGALRIGSAKSQ
jgi:hypothetical protein